MEGAALDGGWILACQSTSSPEPASCYRQWLHLSNTYAAADRGLQVLTSFEERVAFLLHGVHGMLVQ